MKKIKLISNDGIKEISERDIDKYVNENIYVEKFYVQYKNFKCDFIGIEDNKLKIMYVSPFEVDGIFGFIHTGNNVYINIVDIDDCIKVYCKRRILKGDFDLIYQENYYSLNKLKEAIKL